MSRQGSRPGKARRIWPATVPQQPPLRLSPVNISVGCICVTMHVRGKYPFAGIKGGSTVQKGWLLIRAPKQNKTAGCLMTPGRLSFEGCWRLLIHRRLDTGLGSVAGHLVQLLGDLLLR